MVTNKNSKRNLILEVAFKLLLVKGFTNTKIIDIANEANIGKGTVYEYFKSKDTLFCEIFKKKVVSIYSKLPKRLENHPTYTEKLKYVVNFELECINSYGKEANNIIPCLYCENSFDEYYEYKMAVHELVETKFEILNEIISKGIEAGEFKGSNPHLITTSIMGAMQFYLAYSCNEIPEMLQVELLKDKTWEKNEFYDLIFKGLLND